MSTSDVFDVLGISGREDSYTDLLKFAFDNNEHFKKNFSKYFSGNAIKQYDDYKLWVRKQLPAIKLSERKKEVPDMVLFSKINNDFVIIENKIFSGEGYKQTLRYSDEGFLIIVRGVLGLNEKAIAKFYYVTLDAIKPESRKFTPKRWGEVISNCCKDVEFVNTQLKFLMNDLNARSLSYDNIATPNGKEKLSEYTKKTDRWIDSYKLFTVFFDDFVEYGIKKLKLNSSYSYANKNGDKQYLILFWDDEWKSKGREDIGFANVRNIHIELNWREKTNKLQLLIHYETEPYMTQTKIKKLGISNSEIQKYINNRTAFTEKLHSFLEEPLKPHNYDLQLAKVEIVISKDMTKDYILGFLIKNIDKAYKSIINALKS